MLFPDPLLTASVYCSGRLSEVIQGPIASFWARYGAQRASSGSYIWLMRYAKRGEHLKVRLHAPEADLAVLRELFITEVDAYLESLLQSVPQESQRHRAAATPIDAEDRGPSLHMDRAFLWTTYQRSHVSLGYDPYLGNDTYVANVTRCLASGTEVILRDLRVDETGEASFSLAQTILLKLFVAGLPVLVNVPVRSSYLLYHRDWLLRSMRLKSGSKGGAKKLAEVLVRFDTQARSRKEQIGKLGEATRSLSSALDPLLHNWRASLSALMTYTRALCADPAYHVDPYAEIPEYVPLFKVFHGIANQLGLTHLNEAFTLHLLRHAVAQGEILHRPVRLLPFA
jgi:hypothetical protein